MANSTRKAADAKNHTMNGKSNGTSKKHLNGHAIGDVRDGLFEDKAVEEVEETDIEEVKEEHSKVATTDDLVRMYLMQMGQIPLLSRAEEIDAAKAIEHARVRFRHSMLATDYMLQAAVATLEKVQSGELRLDRTIEVSVTNTAEKKRTLKRLACLGKTDRPQHHSDSDVGARTPDGT